MSAESSIGIDAAEARGTGTRRQAAETALKAFLGWHQVPFRKTHSLEELGEPCLKLDTSLVPQIDTAVPLSEYPWKFRCLGEPEAPPESDAHEAIAIASALLRVVQQRLDPVIETHPPGGSDRGGT